MIQPFRLQLKDFPWHYIITGDEWFIDGWKRLPRHYVEFKGTGIATIYPEHDLLWLIDGTAECPLVNFEGELSSWEATRYAVVECGNNYDEDGRIIDYALLLFDCGTGERLIDAETSEPFTGRAVEVARLRRGIDQLMRGESFSLV